MDGLTLVVALAIVGLLALSRYAFRRHDESVARASAASFDEPFTGDTQFDLDPRYAADRRAR
jgi:hypothetical protein